MFMLFTEEPCVEPLSIALLIHDPLPRMSELYVSEYADAGFDAGAIVHNSTKTGTISGTK